MKLQSLAVVSISLFAIYTHNTYAVNPFPRQAIPKIDPARIEQRAPSPIIPKAKPKVKVEKEKPSTKPRKAKQPKFKLNKIIIKGNTVFTDTQLKLVYAKFLHKDITLIDLQKIAAAITIKYRKAGFIISKAVIPAQRIKKGVVTIKIFEGYINKILIQGKTRNIKALLKAYGDRIRKSKPLNAKVLEHYVLLANDLPGVSVKTVLAPAKTAPGASDLTFIVKQHRFDIYANYNNRGTKQLGPNQVSATLQGYALFGSADTLGVRAVTTPENKEIRYGQIYYDRPIGTNGAVLHLATDYTITHPDISSLTGNGSITGRSFGGNAKVSYPIIRTRRKNLNVDLAFNWLDTSSIYGEPLFKDHIRSINAGFNYDFVDSLLGVNLISMQAGKGLPIFAASDRNPGIPLSRAGGRSDYTKLNMEFSRAQGINKYLSMLLVLRGQYAFNQLLSAEEFGFGGSLFGRGFDSSEITGDSGIAGKLEFRWTNYINWTLLKRTQFYAFVDAGKAWNAGGKQQQADSEKGISTGGGLRIKFCRYLNGEVEIAKPLSYSVQPGYLTGNPNKVWRIYVGITASL